MIKVNKIVVFAVSMALVASSGLAGCSQQPPANENKDNQELVVTDKKVDIADMFLGTWQSDRANLEVTEIPEGYHFEISWSSSATETSIWKYDCMFDGKIMTAAPTGVKTNVTYGEDGTVQKEEVEYSDGTATFEFDGENKLIWTDLKETPNTEVVFEHMVTGGTITSDKFLNNFFKPVAGDDQTEYDLGAVTYDVLEFAKQGICDKQDASIMRSQMLQAYGNLTSSERKAFDEHFMEIVKLIDKCQSDWDSVKSTFDLSGTALEIQSYVTDTDVMASWDTLKGNVLTLGNSDGE